MGKGFVIYAKRSGEKEGPYVVISLRVQQRIQWEYDKLSGKSGRSRNELMCRALEYALGELILEPPESPEPLKQPPEPGPL